MKKTSVPTTKTRAPQAKPPRRKHSFLLILLVLAFVGVIAVGSIMNYKQAADNNREAAQKSAAYEDMVAENEELERFLQEKNHDEYMEKIAREQRDYARPGERVVHDSSFGN